LAVAGLMARTFLRRVLWRKNEAFFDGREEL
jgi:hypothetical protein